MGHIRRSIDGLSPLVVGVGVDRPTMESDDGSCSLTSNRRSKMEQEGGGGPWVRETIVQKETNGFRELKEASERGDRSAVLLELEGIMQKRNELGTWSDGQAWIVLEAWEKWEGCERHAATLLRDWANTAAANASTELTCRAVDQCTSTTCNRDATDENSVVELLLRLVTLPACQGDRAVKAMGCLGMFFNQCAVFPKAWDNETKWRTISENVIRLLIVRKEFEGLCGTLLERYCCFLSLPSEDHVAEQRWLLYDRILRRCVALGDAIQKETNAQCMYWSASTLRSFVASISCQEVRPRGIPALVQSLCGLLNMLEDCTTVPMQKEQPKIREMRYLLWTRMAVVARTCPFHDSERDLVLDTLSLALSRLSMSTPSDEVFSRLLLRTLFHTALSLSEMVGLPIGAMQEFLSQMQGGIIFQCYKAILRTFSRFLVHIPESVRLAFLDDLVGSSKKIHFDYKEILWHSCPRNMKLLEGSGLNSILAQAHLCHTYVFHKILSLPSSDPASIVAPVLTSLAYLDFCRVQSDLLLSLISDCVLLASVNHGTGQRIATSITMPDPSLDKKEWELFSVRIMEDKLMQSVFLFQLRLLPLVAGVLPGSVVEEKIIPMSMSFLTHSNPLLCHDASLLFLSVLDAAKKQGLSFAEQCVPTYTRLVLDAFPSVLGVDALREALAGLIMVYSGDDLNVRFFLEDLLALAKKMCEGLQDNKSLESLLSLLFQATSAVGLSHLEWYLRSLEDLLFGPMHDKLDERLLSGLRSSIARSYDYDRKPACVAWYQRILCKVQHA